MTDELAAIAARVWELAGGTPDVSARLAVTGPRAYLPSAFDVTGLATATVAAATLAAAEYQAARNGSPPAATRVDSRAACAAFAAEGLFRPVGWSLPDIWDPIAGNYRALDGWIRLHTNYASHRAAATRVLGVEEPDAVGAAAGRWKAADLEAAVAAAGGCAAVMHERETWLATPPGAATADAPALAVAEQPLAAGPATGTGAREGHMRATGPAERPYAGVRVLDLTRVIAGPIGTRFLAAYGADVLRIDPPGFAEVPAILPETTAGKRTAAVNLATPAGRTVFERLVAGADVLVTGLRADALGRLGYDDAALTALNPALIVTAHNAYGWAGPWRDRRGFDSLVQMSCGIAAAGAAAAGADGPVPLPVQALDHATGYLLAAAVGRALTARLTRGTVTRVRASLAGTANLLWSLPRPEGSADQPPMPRPADIPLVDTETAWGPARQVPVPGEISGTAPELVTQAGPLGRHEPAW
jgi:crotonobetainyl-CoA:carnitine CoA-transferase CaiB-like acyl-CoA transferase